MVRKKEKSGKKEEALEGLTQSILPLYTQTKDTVDHGCQLTKHSQTLGTIAFVHRRVVFYLN